MNWIHTHLVMPLADPERCAGLPGRLRAIRHFEHLTEKAQRSEQQRRLRRLLQHAYDTVPYYRQQFDRTGFRASDARVDRPLPLPVLTQDHLRTASNSLRSTAYAPGKLRMAACGGNSSAPIRFRRDAEGVRDKVALKLKLDAFSGLKAGDSVMLLWAPNCSLTRESNWRWRTYEGVFMRQTPTPGGDLDEETLERLRWRYEKQRPKALYGRASLLAALASYLRDHGRRHRPQIVIATAEILTHQDRSLMKSVFGTMPFNYYGSRDVGMIGAECPEHEGLHFHPWGSYVEFDPIGETPNGPAYRLLVTDLLNYGQPFIRYDTGDIVTLAQQSCSCGRWFPLVDEVLGHAADKLIRVDASAGPPAMSAPTSLRIEQPLRRSDRMRIERKRPGNRRLDHELRIHDLSA
jgi:phenylacetate-CoA ligase